jgi:hypothetical protein
VAVCPEMLTTSKHTAFLLCAVKPCVRHSVGLMPSEFLPNVDLGLVVVAVTTL